MEASQSSTSTDYFNDDDPLFLEALNNIDFPQVSDPQPPPLKAPKTIPSINNGEDGVELEMPPPGQPGL